MTATTATNAIAIAKQLGFSKIKIVIINDLMVGVQGRAVYAKVRAQLDRQIGFAGTVEATDGDTRHHVWARPGLGTVRLHGKNSTRTQEDVINLGFEATAKTAKATKTEKKLSAKEESALEKRTNLTPPMPAKGKMVSVLDMLKNELDECLALGMFKGKGKKIAAWIEANKEEAIEAFKGGLDSNEVIDMAAALV